MLRMTRWIAAAGAFLVSLDSMVNIAFPAMATAFAVPPDAMRWVIMCYVFTYSLVSFAGGTAADRIGHARVFSTGVAVTALAFVVATMAPAFGWLLAARVLQGLGGGRIDGTAPGLITLAAAPSARGRALGFLNAAIGVAFAVGPIVAGGLLEVSGWRAVFAARLPVALAVLAWAWSALPRARVATAPPRMVAADLARLPVLHACALSFLANAGIFAIWLLAPFYLVQHRGHDAFVGGLLFMLTPLGTAVAAPLAGRLADRLGTRLPSVIGLAMEAAGLLALSGAGRTTPVLAIVATLFGSGFGLGLFQVPNMSAVMGAFPAGQQGGAGGLAFMARTLGVVGGVAALSEIFAMLRGSGFEAGFMAAFVTAGAAVAVAAAAACLPARP
jgi:DHA2 family multidrug resistance protein-like MFS transporter